MDHLANDRPGDTPRVSVIVPTRRRPTQLRACLERLAPGRQTCPAHEYEVIVADDDRDQPAQEWVERQFPWARWVQGPGRGRAANRNSGLHHARGEWIAFTDDDCLPEPDWLTGYMHHLKPMVRAYEGRTTCLAGCYSPLDHAPENLTGGLFFGCNVMVAAALLRNLGGFDENFVSYSFEDFDLQQRILDAGETIAFVPTATVDHPPRRLQCSAARAAGRENHVYFNLKHGRRCSLPGMLKLVALERARAIRRRRWQGDSVRLAAMALSELGHIAWHWQGWRRRADALCAGSAGSGADRG